MPIKNITRDCLISKNAKLCCDSLSKFVGLMFSKKSDTALIFKFDDEKRIALHMIFVFYPIDVLFLNERKIVVEMKENFRPFGFYTPKKKAKYVVELPSEIIKKTGTRTGDKINF